MHQGHWTHGVSAPRHPVILSVPHAGRDYPPGFAQLCRHPPARLRHLEDRFADALIEDAIDQGFAAIVASTPRTWVDLNRSEGDRDPAMFDDMGASGHPVSHKARGGLGIIPRRTSQTGELWFRKLRTDELEARLDLAHRPYHAEIEAALVAARKRFGAAILLDVHSMPPAKASPGTSPPRIVIGDRFGKTAAARFSECALDAARGSGHAVTANIPYAGGHILERHADPEGGIHALQLEIDRTLYLDRGQEHTGPGLVAMRRLVASIAVALSDEALGGAFAVAAE